MYVFVCVCVCVCVSAVFARETDLLPRLWLFLCREGGGVGM